MDGLVTPDFYIDYSNHWMRRLNKTTEDTENTENAETTEDTASLSF